MTFSEALTHLKISNRVQRQGWNGRGMFLFLADSVPGFAPFIAINTGREVYPWLASQADLLEEDWVAIAGSREDPGAMAA